MHGSDCNLGFMYNDSKDIYICIYIYIYIYIYIERERERERGMCFILSRTQYLIS